MTSEPPVPPPQDESPQARFRREVEANRREVEAAKESLEGKKPEIPEAWKQPPDLTWQASQDSRPGGCERAMMVMAIIVLGLFGTCMLLVAHR